jgi:hypothetical protein
VRKAVTFSLLALFALAASASALSPGQVSATLSPNKIKASSKLSVMAQGPFPGVSGLPSSLALFAQRGFKSDARSVATKCTAQQAGSSQCPAGSKIGNGSATAQVQTNVGLGSGTYTVPFTLFLGPAQQSGDIASVVLQGSVTLPVVGTQKLSTTGRLFKVAGTYGLELLFANFPTIMLPTGVTATITLNQLSFSASASRVVKKTVKVHGKKKKVKVRYSLITNPPTCGKSKTWSAKVVVTFPSGGSITKTPTTPCRTH